MTTDRQTEYIDLSRLKQK